MLIMSASLGSGWVRPSQFLLLEIDMATPEKLRGWRVQGPGHPLNPPLAGHPISCLLIKTNPPLN